MYKPGLFSYYFFSTKCFFLHNILHNNMNHLACYNLTYSLFLLHSKKYCYISLHYLTCYIYCTCYIAQSILTCYTLSTCYILQNIVTYHYMILHVTYYYTCYILQNIVTYHYMILHVIYYLLVTFYRILLHIIT